MTFELSATNKKLKVLIVDDSEDFRGLIKAYLSSFPIEIDEAEDGTEALDALKEITYDLVIMDYRMPVMDGVSATRLLREWEKEELKEHVIIVALTAYGHRVDKENFINAGCNQFLTKPIKRSDLIETLNLLFSV